MFEGNCTWGSFVSGVYRYASGLVYRGEYYETRPHGNGRVEYPNKDVYIGEWENGIREGKGKYIYAEGGGEISRKFRC